ncbi:MAG: hypothetical protein LBI59_07455 [Candidatus Accumulibacter sp.]|nr:hypothetical protein [Accumulibacter sp.]
MIEFSEEALAYIGERKSPVVIDIPYKVSGCCFDVAARPSVRLGEPKERAEDYVRQDSQGVTLYVPRCFADARALTIRLHSFLGFRGLIVDGWKPI